MNPVDLVKTDNPRYPFAINTPRDQYQITLRELEAIFCIAGGLIREYDQQQNTTLGESK
jgi:hypothetical protein